jgi:hypothetical protein
MSHDVFISYATEDKATADAICAALDARVIRCWIASRDIMPSERYAREIIEAIDASRVLVLVLSSHSNRSPFVASEVGRAFTKGLRIIPFRIEEVLPSDDLALFISDPQWLDALEPPMKAHLARLAETVERLLSDRPPPPPEPRRGGGWKPLPIIVTAVVALTLVAFAVWFFSRPKVAVGGGTTTQPQPPTQTQTQPQTQPQTQTQIQTQTPTQTQTPAVNYEQLYNLGVEMLSDTSQSMQKRSEGVRLLGEVAASGDGNLYWRAMKPLTDHVRASVPWHEGEDAPPKDMPQDVLRALEVITARPPIYPASADDKYKREHRRDLRFTDLRGLRLVGTAHLEYADLQGANLDGAVLSGAEMQGVMLRDASLRGVNLSGARMNDVDLAHADITQADLRQVKGLKSFDAGSAYNWQCANLDNDLRTEIQSTAGPKVSAKKCT